MHTNRPTVAPVLTCIILVLIFSSFISCSKRVPGRLVCTIDYKALGLHDVVEEGGGSFSVLAGDRVAITEGKELLLIEDGRVSDRLKLPTNITWFDLTSAGNGILQTGDSLYLVQNLVVDSIPYRHVLPDSLIGSYIVDVDMISPSGVRLAYDPSHRNHDLLEYSATTTFDSIREGSFAIRFDRIPRLPYSWHGFISNTDSTFYMVDGSKDLRLQVDAYTIDAEGFHRQRGTQLGMSGKSSGSIMYRVQYQEETCQFYVMIEHSGNLVIYEYDIRDFQLE